MSIADELYEIYLANPVVTTDSRRCPEGSLFFALKGATFDGNRFAAAALEAGAACAVIDDPSCKTSERMVLVEDALTALQHLACHHRMRLGIPVVAITGTNGKTTTKELVAAVLSTSRRLIYTEGNLNNHIGVPLTLLRLRREHEMAVVEMGANHPGEIRLLAEIARPDYGLITNIGYAHLEGFGSIEGVLRAKGELYDYLRKTRGTIFIRKEDERLNQIAGGLAQVTYGADSNAFVSGQSLNSHPYLSFEWSEAATGDRRTVRTQIVGEYNINNALAAIAVGRSFGVAAEAVDRAIEAYTPSNNRSQFKATAHNRLIIDAYNANASSMDAALTNFAALPDTPKAVILGDMLELGTESLRLHTDVVRRLEHSSFDKMLLCGNIFSATQTGLPCFANVEELKSHLVQHPLHGYNILIKGSHGVRLEQVLDVL